MSTNPACTLGSQTLFAGIGLGGNGAKIGIVTAGGKLVDSVYMEIGPGQRTPDFVLSGIPARFDIVLTRKGLSRERLAGVGFGFPGFLQRDGMVVKSPAFPEFNGLNIVLEMERVLGGGLQVFSANDANAYAVGEMLFGIGKKLGITSGVAYTLGTGVGGGIVIDGKLHIGDRGMAGELGHHKVMRGRLRENCGCDKNGCLEQLCGEKGFQTMIKNHLIAEDDARQILGMVGQDLSKVTPLNMAAFAGAGDQCVEGAWRLYGTFLGQAIADTVLNFGIDTIILGGGIARSIHLFVGHIQKTLSEELIADVASGVRIVKGDLDPTHAEILGAAALAARGII